MVTKKVDAPAIDKPKRRRKKFRTRVPAHAKRGEMEEYARTRALILGWCKRVRTCEMPELMKIAGEAKELRQKLEDCESAVLMIFRENFKEIDEVAASRMRREKGRPVQP